MAVDWHTLSQDTVPTVSTTGKLVHVKQIRFRVDTEPGEGHEDMVEVEDQPGYAARAVPLIEAKVAEIKAMFTA